MSAVAVTLSARDLKGVSKALGALAEMRVNDGVEVTELRVGDDVFSLAWDDAVCEYTIGSIA